MLFFHKTYKTLQNFSLVWTASQPVAAGKQPVGVLSLSVSLGFARFVGFVIIFSLSRI